MILGYLRGPTRAMGIDLNPQADFDFKDVVDAAALPNTAERQNLLIHGTLVHERTHWLHFVATTSGVFHIAVWEAQALAAKELVSALGETTQVDHFPLKRIGRSFPGLLSIPKVAPLLDCWTGLENLQSWMFGAAGAPQLKPPTKASLEFLASFLRQWLVTRNPNASEHSKQTIGRYDCPVNYGDVCGIQKRGVAVGTYQVTEAIARLNEFAVLTYGLERHAPSLSITLDHLFDGVYGHARELFYKCSNREVGHVSETIFAILAHDALNAPLPPLSEMSTFSNPWLELNPYQRLAAFARRTKDFEAAERKSIGIKDVREIRAEIRQVLLADELVVADAKLAAHAREVFSGFSTFEIPADLYTVENGRAYPVDYMRYKYLGRLFYNAFGLYATHADFVTFPGLYYVSERKRFRELLRDVRPPILFAQGEGYRPTYEDPAAHAVLLLDVFVNEILRGAMSYRYSEFLDVMRGFIRHVKHQKYTEDAFSVGLLNAGFGESFARQICADVDIKQPNF